MLCGIVFYMVLIRIKLFKSTLVYNDESREFIFLALTLNSNQLFLL